MAASCFQVTASISWAELAVDVPAEDLVPGNPSRGIAVDDIRGGDNDIGKGIGLRLGPAIQLVQCLGDYPPGGCLIGVEVQLSPMGCIQPLAATYGMESWYQVLPGCPNTASARSGAPCAV